MLEEKSLTRRSLLSGAGKIAVVGAGIAAVSGGLNLFQRQRQKAGQPKSGHGRMRNLTLKKPLN